jgi:quercetin dioxygenase-like cupin family protein
MGRIPCRRNPLIPYSFHVAICRISRMSAMSNAPLWPDELDALLAAPLHHALLFENESVRVLDTHVLPGETVPLHTHRWPAALYILSWSHFVRRDGEGAVMVDSRMGGSPAEGVAVWSGPLPPHTLENVGESELRVISVELKSSGAAAP